MLPSFNFSSDTVDPPLADPYQQRSTDDSARSIQTSLSLNYPYLDDPYLPFPHQAHPPASHTRSRIDPHCLPTPVSDMNLSYTPISRQLIYPAIRRTDQTSPASYSADNTPSNMVNYYTPTSQQLFPTPSELLVNQSGQRDVSGSRPFVQPSPPPQMNGQHTRSSDVTSIAPLNVSINKTESQRKARQRAIAEEIGFAPTDPDTISSHEKKRHYLECLEQYVLYLHEQLRLVQTAPLALERVSTYRGLSSRSIRTLLVHMQNTNKTLHEGTLVEEQVFLDLSAQVMAAHGASLPFRRHSIDVAGMSRNANHSPSLLAFDPASSLPSDDMTASASPGSVDGSSTSPDLVSTDLMTQRILFPGVGEGA